MLVMLLLAAAAGGVWYASRVRLAQEYTVTSATTSGSVITHITVGALARAEEATATNPRLMQTSSYTTSDSLVMRIVSAPDVQKEFQVGVRLLTPSGSVVEMDPPAVTFQPGTSSFCCWQIAKEGTYTLQIFRPEKTISSIPLKIQKSWLFSINGGTTQP